MDFCRFCGAGVPPKFGEGTCEKCDPKVAELNNKKNREEFVKIFAARLQHKVLFK